MATRRGFLAALAALLPAALAARMLPAAKGLPAYDLGAVAKPLFPDIPRIGDGQIGRFYSFRFIESHGEKFYDAVPLPPAPPFDDPELAWWRENR